MDAIRLRRFLKSYLRWIANGAPHAQPYFRNRGLCRNVDVYAPIAKLSDEDAENLLCHLVDCFSADFAEDMHFPFNAGNKDEYFQETRKRECYLNEKRIAWAKKNSKLFAMRFNP